jgi:hypothetical protein
MKIDSRWLSKNFKQKYFLLCRGCIADFPQKVKVQQENRNKVINICEIKK